MFRSLYFPPAVIFAVILVATMFGWQAANAALSQDIAAAADSRTDAAEQTLRERMVTYGQILHGSAGLFRSSNEVTLKEWNNFLNAFTIDKELSGIQGIGYIKVFKHGELDSIKSSMARHGVTDFNITPLESPRDEYAAVLYIHAVESEQNPPYGYDMYSEATRRSTMYKARDNGDIAMTPRIGLLPADPASPRYGFNLYTPYYGRDDPQATTEQRQKSLEGYVYASFRANEFFENVMKRADSKNAGFRVIAGTDGTKELMYESPAYAKISRRPQATQVTRQAELYGQTWTINFAYETGALVSDEQLGRPDIILFFGAFSAVLISLIVLLLLRARARELSTQKEKAVELAKDELLSLASHQLRTPATGVKQYIGMVLQGFAGKVPASQRSLLEKAYASNDRQLRIINEILHLAKIDSGRIVLAKQITNLNDLVTDIVNEQRPDIETARHRLKLSLPKHPITVNADTHILRMAIENLLSNAIKYTPRGGGINIRVFKDRQRARVSIQDTGVGINSGDRDKIFRQFSRLPNEMSQQVGGTGIGLYLAKHLVELHKGTIDVKSEPGKGSTFTIGLPLHGSAATAMRNLTVRAKA